MKPAYIFCYCAAAVFGMALFGALFRIHAPWPVFVFAVLWGLFTGGYAFIAGEGKIR